MKITKDQFKNEDNFLIFRYSFLEARQRLRHAHLYTEGGTEACSKTVEILNLMDSIDLTFEPLF